MTRLSSLLLHFAMSTSNPKITSTSNKSPTPFPVHRTVPKAETNVIDFLKQNPTYDGRDVIIGILDTGVDPGAIGMQSLPHCGDTKLIDIIDCTGSGDVDVTTEVDAVWVEKKDGEEHGYWEVKGLTGRTLRLNPDWNLCPFPTNITSAKEEKKDAEDSKEESKDGESASDSNATASVVEDEPSNSTPAADAKTAKVRLGIKRAYELFPNKLVNRVKGHRSKDFDKEQRRHAADVRKLLEDWHASYSAKTATHEQIRVKEDLEARLEFLEPGGDDSVSYEDPGLVYDCIVYYDGTNYRAAIDVNCDGDLTKTQSLTDYNIEKEYGTFSNVDMFNYGIHTYDDGTVLSIVCDAGAHGSHVAGISAAYHPQEDVNNDEEEGNVNGVAPGAKIVSLKIGDSRLGSMETGTALNRALIQAVKSKCDVINLSYGEASAVCDSGRFISLADKIVQDHNIIFVSSAGNNGPALTTVGAPGGTSTNIISVAAYVSPEMMETGYSLITSPKWAGTANGKNGKENVISKPIRSSTDVKSDVDMGSSSVLTDTLTGTTYTWSSVGPASDGDSGVNICAPGGAITCVPNWTLQRKQLMNGTSMSSPHAAGCVALLLSACKAMGIVVNANRIRRAMENTARKMDGLSALEQGAGMVQVDKAWEYLMQNQDEWKEDIHFKVCIDNRAGRPRGVYLRQPDEVTARQTLSVNVDPQFRENDVDLETQTRRVEFEMQVDLKSTVPWVQSPDHLVLLNNGRSFKIEVDPTNLPPGVHTGLVQGYDATRPGRGPMFSVPITVVRPLEQSKDISIGKLQFGPSEAKRFFLDVPAGATWMDVSVRDLRVTPEEQLDGSPRLLVLHNLQLLPHTPYSNNEKQMYLNLSPGQTSVSSIPVHGGITSELCLARYWSTKNTSVEVSVDFRGVRPVPDVLHMSSGGGGASVRISSDLQDETIMPSAKLSKWLTPIKPKTSGVVTSLGERDVLPTTNANEENKHIYQMVLTYEFEQTEENGAFTPRVPSLQNYLYESAFESQLIMIYDKDKKILGVKDAFPNGVKAKKGTVTIRLQVRHDKPDMLNKLKDQIMWIERKPTKEITLSAYNSQAAMVSGGDAFKKRGLRKGTSISVFFADPASSNLPKGCKCGDVLTGVVNYASGEGSLPGSGKKPGGFPVRYIVGPSVDSKDSSSEGKTPDLPDERSEAEKLEEAVQKLQIERLGKLSEDDKEDKKFKELYNKVFETTCEDGAKLSLLMVGLKHEDNERWREKRLNDVIDAADKIVDLIDENELILHYGVTGYYDKEDAKACKDRKDMDEKKNILIEALARKARAVADLEKNGSHSSDEKNTTSSFDDTIKGIKRWVDIDSNLKYAVLVLERERRAERPGAVLKLLKKLLKNNGDDTKGGICPLTKSALLERRAAVFKELGYSHLVEHDNLWKLLSSPKDFALF